MAGVKPRRAARITAALLAAAVPALVAGCSSSLPKSVPSAPVLSVVTGLWPLAQAAAEIGGDKVAVDDLVPPGRDPLGFQPGAAGARVMHAAGLVLVGGRGLQPALESAAAGSPRVLRLADALGTPNPYVWLDPATMERAVQSIGDAMAAANPGAAPLYRRNAAGLRSEIDSLGIDYSGTLSTCQATTVVTPDGAFSGMAAQYGLTDVVAPADITSAGLAGIRSRLAEGRTAAGLSQPWVDNGGVEQVSLATGIRVHGVDTLAGAPATGTSVQNTYMNRMEQVLGVLSGALACDTGQQ